MAQTVIGIFDNASEAQNAVERLVDNGFTRDSIDIMDQGSGMNTTGTGYAQGTTGYSSETGYSGSATNDTISLGATRDIDVDRDRDRDRDRDDNGGGIGGFFRSLFGGDDDDEYTTSRRYTDVANRGTVVSVYTQTADEAERAADILDDAGAVDVDERASQYGYTTGSTTSGMDSTLGMDTTSNAYPTDRDRITADDDTTMKVMEENLNVGKREVETGGVRLRSRIVERPVEEIVRLREEHVRVVRTPVDRPATDADFNTFREGDIEVTERAEVPVVGKEARVVEEISLGKDVEEREETVRDTVRKTEVDVENINSTDMNRGMGSSTTGRTTTDLDDDFNTTTNR